MEGLADEAIEKGQTLDAALAAMRGKRVKDLEVTANKTPGPDDDREPGKKDHLSRAKEYKAANKCSMAEALHATAEPRKK